VVEGERFDVTLADLPGAGYTWTTGDLPAGLTLIEMQSRAPASEIVGSAQDKVLQFRADRAGDYEVVFTLARSWEDSVAETRTVRVHVRPPEPAELR
jgi:predicted secreted protein